jgi:ATP-dependent DNA helicase PIF1
VVDRAEQQKRTTTRKLNGTYGSVFDNAPVPERLYLFEGAQVVVRQQIDVHSGLHNQALGTVVGFRPWKSPKDASRTPPRPYPVVRMLGGRKVEWLVTPEEFEIKEGRWLLARRTQLPLELAFAMNTHDMQGRSVSQAVLDPSGAFECGQIYTLFSRVETLAGVHLRHLPTAKSVRAHAAVLDYLAKTPTHRFAAKRGREEEEKEPPLPPRKAAR